MKPLTRFWNGGVIHVSIDMNAMTGKDFRFRVETQYIASLQWKVEIFLSELLGRDAIYCVSTRLHVDYGVVVRVVEGAIIDAFDLLNSVHSKIL